jgi:hypothetical protein
MARFGTIWPFLTPAMGARREVNGEEGTIRQEAVAPQETKCAEKREGFA